jgi:hypothetical protein
VKAYLFGMMNGLKDALHISAEGLRTMKGAFGEWRAGNPEEARRIIASSDDMGNAWKTFATDTPVLDNAAFGTRQYELQNAAITADNLPRLASIVGRSYGGVHGRADPASGPHARDHRRAVQDGVLPWRAARAVVPQGGSPKVSTAWRATSASPSCSTIRRRTSPGRLSRPRERERSRRLSVRAATTCRAFIQNTARCPLHHAVRSYSDQHDEVHVRPHADSST